MCIKNTTSTSTLPYLQVCIQKQEGVMHRCANSWTPHLSSMYPKQEGYSVMHIPVNTYTPQHLQVCIQDRKVTVWCTNMQTVVHHCTCRYVVVYPKEGNYSEASVGMGWAISTPTSAESQLNARACLQQHTPTTAGMYPKTWGCQGDPRAYTA